MSILNQILGGTQGLGQGLQQQARFKADQADKAYQNEDRLAQTALRNKQAAEADRLAQQDADLASPDFQDTYLKAIDGDNTAKANVMRRAAGHRNMTAILEPLLRNKPVAPRDPVADDKAKWDYRRAHPLPKASGSEELTPTIGPNGTPVWGPKVTGGAIPGATSTPRMARAPTEAQEKSYLFHTLMDKAEPEIEAAISSGNVRPEAVSAFLTASKIPLAGGLLATLVNSGLNAEEQTLLRAGADFAAGVKRKESGAAVSNPEIAEVFGRYFPGVFGDTPELTESKKAARKAYRETMKQSASPAIMYYQQVEKQGNPEIDPEAEAGDPGGGNVAPAPKTVGVAPVVDETALSDADLWERKRKGGMSAMQATAYVANRKKAKP